MNLAINHMVIRNYLTSDYPQMRELFDQVWMKTYVPTLGLECVEKMLAELDASKMKNMMPGEDETTFVACLGSDLLGTLTIAERGDVAYLWGMYVNANYQRQCVGTSLLNHVVKKIKIAKTIEIRALNSSPRAISFYQKQGFVISGSEQQELAVGRAVPGTVMVLSNPLYN